MTDDQYNEMKIVAKETAAEVIIQHLKLCPFADLQIERRVRTIETRYAALVGFMLGSGILGGTAGALLTKLIGQ
jgi:hypothetical protein